MVTFGMTITTYNRKRFTDQCLKSIIWSKPKHTKIIIVDNNSTDGTREEVLSKYENHPLIEKIIYNSTNKHLGMAVYQGWNYFKNKCKILTVSNNDFLWEPGWEQNAISCFNEITNLDYIIGTIRLEDKTIVQKTKSGKGRYTKITDAGGAYFLLPKHFKAGIYPSVEPFRKGYIGPGKNWQRRLRGLKMNGVRLYSPGVLIRHGEYTNPEYIKYYNKTFGIRDKMKRLKRFRILERANTPAFHINWEGFLKKYYPSEMRKEL